MYVGTSWVINVIVVPVSKFCMWLTAFDRWRAERRRGRGEEYVGRNNYISFCCIATYSLNQNHRRELVFGAKQEQTWKPDRCSSAGSLSTVVISDIGELSLQFPIYWREVGDPRILWRNDYCANSLEP